MSVATSIANVDISMNTTLPPGVVVNETATPSTISTSTKTSTTTATDFLSLIQERDSLRNEVDSLRPAVIILGIISSLAVIAVIVGVAWYFMKRRRSNESAMKHGQTEMSTSDNSRGQKATEPPANMVMTKNRAGKQQRHEGQLQTKATQDTSRPSSISLESPDETLYQPAEYPRHTENAMNKETPAYVNTNRELVRSVSVQNDSESYVDLDDTGSRKETASIDKTYPSGGPTEMNSDPGVQTDEIYENFSNDTKVNNQYSALNPETEYSHKYESL